MKQTPKLRHLLNNRAIFFIFLVFYLGVNNIKINFATKYTIHVINNRLNIILMRKNCILNLSKMSKSLLVLSMLLFAVVENASAQLPSFKLKNIEGKTVDTSTLSNDGKPFIISFFATWCKPCNRELSAIGEVYEDWVAETGVKLYAVSIDKAQNANKVKPLVNQHGWPYEVLLDSNSEFRKSFGGEMIPFVIICDGEGKVVFKHNGYTEGAEQELIEKVRELIK